MKEIPLTKGLVAKVDDEDYDYLSRWKWHAFTCRTGHVYAARNSDCVAGERRTHVFMHRVVAGTPEGMITDHINGDGLDNRRENLRDVTRTENMWNRKANSRGSSKHKGVHWHRQHKKWAASIQVNKRRHHIGLFADEEEAARAYAARAAKEFGEYNRSAE